MSKSNYLKQATDAGDQFLSTLAEGQESFLKSLATLSTPPPAPVDPGFRDRAADVSGSDRSEFLLRAEALEAAERVHREAGRGHDARQPLKALAVGGRGTPPPTPRPPQFSLSITKRGR